MKDYLVKYKKRIMITAIIVLIVIPLCIHVLFKTEALFPFFVATWTAGDVLAFYGVIIGAVATVGGVYISIHAAQANYREDVVYRSLPFMATTVLRCRTENLFSRKPAPQTGFMEEEVTGFKEYDIERLYYVIKDGAVYMQEHLSDEQMKVVENGGFERIVDASGVETIKAARSIYTTIEVENVGNGPALFFSVGFNCKEMAKENRKFSIAKNLRVGQKFYISIFSKNPDKKNYGQYDLCLSYYDVLGNGYEQNFQYKLYEVEKFTGSRVMAELRVNGEQKRKRSKA